MESKEIKQGVALKEVFTTAEISEEVDKLQEECKGVGINQHEVLPSMKDNHHHGTIILHDFEDLSCGKKVLEMKVLISSSSYHILSTRESNVFLKICQIPSPLVF